MFTKRMERFYQFYAFYHFVQLLLYTNQVHTGVYMVLLVLEKTCLLNFHPTLQFCYCTGHEC